MSTLVKTTLCIAYLFLLNVSSNAQEKFQLNLVLGPSYENIGTRNSAIENPFSFKYSYNFGAEIKYYTSPRFSTNLGLQFNDRGFQSNINYLVLNDTISSSVSIAAQYISIPLDFTWNFSPIFRTEYFFNIGVNYGILVSQTFKGSRIPEALGRPANGIYEGVSTERSNINWFDKNYLGLQAGLGISRYIKSRMVFTFHPSVSIQVDRLINPEGPVLPIAYTDTGLPVNYSPKLTSFLLLFKVGYYFSDQIENTKKAL